MLRWMIFCILVTSRSSASPTEYEREENKCEAVAKRIVLQDRTSQEDKSPTRLHSTWVSQECEVRAGPEYLIRKYKFFENGTFSLVRYHYAEESCSVATHTVVARGIIELASSSMVVRGATEARIKIQTVHLIPLNHQVAHKFERRLNMSCGAQPKWQAYTAQLIYERPILFSSALSAHGPIFNTLQIYRPPRSRRGIDCLQSLGIEFSELKLVRVQRKSILQGFNKDENQDDIRVELYLGALPRSIHHWRNYKSTSLQTTPLLRSDTGTQCAICSTVTRSTECNPPLLHEVAPLPALIGGLWLSGQCESAVGGFWAKRLFRIYSGDKLWTARWDYYADPECSGFLYTVSAAGSYSQRSMGQRFTHARLERALEFLSPLESTSPKIERFSFSKQSTKPVPIARKNLNPSRKKRDAQDAYRHILKNTEASMARSLAAILRGNQRESVVETVTESSQVRATVPSGTSELELQVAESLLIPGETKVAFRCGVIETGVPLSSWLRNCVPGTIESPSTLRFRARLGVDWEGEYTLRLGIFDTDIWEPPLRRCSATSTRNSPLKAHLGRTIAFRYGLLPSAVSSSSIITRSNLILSLFIFYFLIKSTVNINLD